MKLLLASTALALALAAPASAAQQKPSDAAAPQPQAQQKTAAGKAQDQAAQRRQASLTVTSADHLVGDTLRDVSGEPAGEIEYVMIDTDSGKVDYIIVGSSDRFDLNGQLAAVPWSSVSITPRSDDVVNLAVGAGQVREAPRFSSERLFELTEPAMVAQITRYYAPPQSGSTQRPSGGERKSAQQDQQQTESGGSILVGRGITTMLLPPLFKSADEIRGTEVELASGEDVGEIDKIMIDAEHGRIYVLIAKGGFLGIDEEWVPAPYDSLRFDPAEPKFVLTTDASRLEQVPVLRKDEAELPTRIRKADLEMLYQRFGVTPYWRS